MNQFVHRRRRRKYATFFRSSTSPGDVLLAYTDGVVEAHNPENEAFGEERLQQLLRQTAHLRPKRSARGFPSR